MPSRSWLIALLLSWTTVGALAAEVEGVKLDDHVKLGAGGAELALNGAGLRTRFVFDVYVAGLYLAEKKTSTAEVLALPGAKRIWLRLMRDISAQQLLDALNEGMRANVPPAELAAIAAQTAELAATMAAIGQGKKGDSIALDYLPGTGTRVVLNGRELGRAIAGEEFYRALLRVWLGDKPVQESLKRALLGAAQ
ncbi:MAG: chalcone isomerase family protein [Betaproteobacteria bacterium]|nr:chalcone isomerase family protein [Betaproteobacteria bacterium]